MSEPSTPHDLRARAARLRVVARTLDNASVLDLHRRAGPDVWVGPTAQRCHDDLRLIRAITLGVADELQQAARSLEQRAEEIERLSCGLPR